MSEFFYQTGWGAFTLMLLMQIPFVVIFGTVVYRKGFLNAAPSDTPRGKLSRLEGTWLAFAAGFFIVVNVLSISYFPMVSTANAAVNEADVQQVDVVARSWSYEISDNQYEVGRPVRFSAKSADTMHSFSVYHPDGRVLFTIQLLPGLNRSASMIYTFKDPGKYTVRCLEYCGIAHHGMMAELIVVDKKSSS